MGLICFLTFLILRSVLRRGAVIEVHPDALVGVGGDRGVRRPVREAAHARTDHGRERVHLVVVVADGDVHVATSDGDAVLGARELGLEPEEALVRAERGVGLHGDEEVAGLLRDALLSRLVAPALGVGRVGTETGHLARGAAQAGDAREDALLVRRRGLDGRDEVGDEVDPALVLGVEVADLGLHLVRRRLRRVEADEGEGDEDAEEGEGDEADDLAVAAVAAVAVAHGWILRCRGT